MRSESLDFPELSQGNASAFKRALAASLVLHGFLVGYVVFAELAVSEQATPVAQVHNLSITLVNNLQTPSALQTNNSVQQDFATAEESDDSISDIQSATPELISTTAVSRTISTPTVNTNQFPAAEAPANQEFNFATMQTAITSYVQGYKQELTGTWTEACLLYKKAHATRICPDEDSYVRVNQPQHEVVEQLFADINRDARHKRIYKELWAETKALEALQDETGPLGELAAERRALNREYLAYLSGNLNSSAMAFVKMTQRDNINLPFMLDNMLQFICKEMPCIYEYEPFRINRPVVDESAEAKSNEFEIRTVLFGSRK